MSPSTLPGRRTHRAVVGHAGALRAGARTRRHDDPGHTHVSERQNIRHRCGAPGPQAKERRLYRLRCGRIARLLRDDAGMSTVEYAIGTVAAAGFAALLYSVVTGDSVTAALTQLVQRALTTTF